MSDRVGYAHVCLALGAALAVSGLVAAWPFTTDDAFITLRYARHWAEGEGVRWNDGEPQPVEGYSNFLFVAIAAAAYVVGLPPLVVLEVTSALAMLASGVLLVCASRRYASPAASTVPALLLWGYPFTAWWATSGLETSVYVALAIASVAAFARGADAVARGGARSGSLRGAGVLAFVASLARPDGPLLVVAMLGVLAGVGLSRRHRRAAVRAAWQIGSAFAVPMAIYLAWRVDYFGGLLPNPMRCKLAWRGNQWTLTADFGLLAIVPLLLAAPGWRRWSRPGVAVCLGVAVLYAAASYGVDPTLGYGNRHVLAAYALLGVPAAIGIDRLALRWRDGLPRLVIGLHAIVCVLWIVGEVPGRLRTQAIAYAARGAAREAVARHVLRVAEADTTVVVGDVGVIGHRLPRAQLVDVYCLNNLEMTRGPLRNDAARLAESVLAELPRVVIVSSRRGDTCEPRAKVFREMLANPRFAAYENTATFGAQGDEFHYWIYEPKEAAAASR